MHLSTTNTLFLLNYVYNKMYIMQNFVTEPFIVGYTTHNFVIEIYILRYITHTTLLLNYIQRHTTHTTLLMTAHIKYRSIVDYLIDD